jgi:cytochrome P450
MAASRAAIRAPARVGADIIGFVAAIEEEACRRTRRVEELPGPRGLPIFGSFLELEETRLHTQVEAWARRYGPMYRFRLGPRDVVAVSDPALVAEVMRERPERYRKIETLEPIFREVGAHGVFSAEGAEWKPQRRLAMEALAQRNLVGFYPTLRSIAERLRRLWERVVDGPPVDLTEHFLRFTVDVTTWLTFGHDVNSLEGGDDVIQRRLELIFPAVSRRLFSAFPTWRYLRMPADRRLDRAIGELETWIAGLIAEARARLDRDTAEPANLLEAMIVARDTDGRPFSDAVISGNAMTMLLGGEDTTATTLAWSVHHLLEAPAEVARLQEEVAAIVGPSSLPDSLEAAGRLAYAGAIAQETMRLRPVGPLTFNAACVDTTLGGVAIPAGTAVLVLSRLPALEEQAFTAAHEFRPSRWIDPPAVHRPGVSIPFGTGPRICPGRSLGLLEMRVVLALLFGAFDLEREGDAAAVKEEYAFTMRPSRFRVRLRRRTATTR